MDISTHPYPVKYVSSGCISFQLDFARYITAVYLTDFFTLGDLLPVMCDRAGFIQDTSLILYEVCFFFSLCNHCIVSACEDVLLA